MVVNNVAMSFHHTVGLCCLLCSLEIVKHLCQEVEEDAKTAKPLIRSVQTHNNPTHHHDAKVLAFTKWVVYGNVDWDVGGCLVEER